MPLQWQSPHRVAQRVLATTYMYGSLKDPAGWDLLIAYQKEASLTNPDPSADSSTAALVSRYSPYMVATYVRPPPVMVKGEGCYIWDMENRKYLDFTSGIAVNALGHCDPEMAKLIGHQVSRLPVLVASDI